MTEIHPGTRIKSSGRYVLVGVLTVAPLAITWVILDFIFRQLSAFGRPLVAALASEIAPDQPAIAALLDNDTFTSVLAALATLLLLWLLGWMTTRVIGQQLIRSFERLIGMIPFVDTVYHATKRFLSVAGTTSAGERRVVLIDFPSPEMKTIGLVTKILKDKSTGQELAAVYVPTAPNPTSGYVEIVPLHLVTFTDWTFDQAMAFIVTGGSNAPETITYTSQSGDARSGS
jgi:uncharacterized membrane protein